MTSPEQYSNLPQNPSLILAMERLASFYAGPDSIGDVVRFGSAATPLLRKLLLGRETSGLHQVRCRAAEALAALGAYDVLEEYLRIERSIADPIERLGEETVVSAAARALARRADNRSFALFERLALRRPLTGVLIALGSFKRTKTIPIFVRALAEDEVRLTVEAVLRSFGSRARPYLMSAACEAEVEAPASESALRRRRSALGLLSEMRLKNSDWPKLKALLKSDDIETAILAAGLGLRTGAAEEQSNAYHVLHRLRIQADWLRRMQIDQYLQRFGPKRKQKLVAMPPFDDRRVPRE